MFYRKHITFLSLSPYILYVTVYNHCDGGTRLLCPPVDRLIDLKLPGYVMIL